MKKLILASALALTFTSTAFAAPTLGAVGGILQQLSEMNNESISGTTVEMTKRGELSGAAREGGASVLEYVVTLLDGKKVIGNETYLVVVDDGLNVQSIQKVLTVNKRK